MGMIKPTTGKLMMDAFGAALAGFGVGLCLGHTVIKHFDGLYVTGLSLSSAVLMFVLFSTWRAVRSTTSETARKSARVFLASCIFFSMITSTFGIAVSGRVWYSADFVRTFGVLFYGFLSCVAIYPVHRDAKRFADAGASQIAPH
jgi:hypothetical protein